MSLFYDIVVMNGNILEYSGVFNRYIELRQYEVYCGVSGVCRRLLVGSELTAYGKSVWLAAGDDSGLSDGVTLKASPVMDGAERLCEWLWVVFGRNRAYAMCYGWTKSSC